MYMYIQYTIFLASELELHGYMETKAKNGTGKISVGIENGHIPYLHQERFCDSHDLLHTLRPRSVSIFDIIKLVYLLFQPHVSASGKSSPVSRVSSTYTKVLTHMCRMCRRLEKP